MTSDNRNEQASPDEQSSRRRRWARRRVLATLAVLVVAATGGAVYGLSGEDRPAQTGPGGQAGGAASASDRFPAATLADWVTYADQLAVVSVTDEAPIPPGPEFAADGDYVLRNVTLRVDRVLWQREGAAKAPDTVSVRTWGWFERNGRRTPDSAEDAPRLEVGERYLTPLVHASDGWTPLADSSILTLSGDQITAKVRKVQITAKVRKGEPRDLARSLAGKSLQETDKAVASTAPVPESAPYRDADPDDRVRKTLEAQYPD